MVMLFVAHVGRIRCLWAIGSECGPIGSESGSQLRFIWSQCGPSREMFVGLRDYVWGPLQVAGASSRQTNSFVMGGSNARGPGGMRATAIRCWHFAVPNITAPSIRSLSVISNDYGKRKIHRMLPANMVVGPYYLSTCARAA